ncbi:RabGAP/TBC [Tothia fuscella]|uniref:RabGAP/TBC n=1 Tax=Tothia fuscella TaxID=1048955 RepID=A0A9P4NNM3_9PEZI|nr:RabGAP/TBC [Tothia fuscella]
MAASADQPGGGYSNGAGEERDVLQEMERATGNLTSIRKGQLYEARAANNTSNPVPGSPTPPSSAHDLDSPTLGDSPKSLTSSNSSPILKLAPSNSAFPDRDSMNGSPRMAHAVISSPTSLPQPHLPLKKKSASHLRLNLMPKNRDDGAEPSPPRSSDRALAHSASPRLYPERQQSLQYPVRHQSLHQSEHQQSQRSGATTPREYEPWPDVGEAIVSPSLIMTRARGLTTTSQTTPTSVSRELKQTSSIPDLTAYRANQRTMATTSTYRPERGPSNRDTGASFRSPPSIPWKESEEVRASFRSALTNAGEVRSSFRSGFTNASNVTYASSNFMDASETERSSVMTRASSLSDMFYKSKMQGMDDEGLTVEDTISLYANGFTDDELERQLDQGIEDIRSFMPAPLDSQLDKPQPPLPREDLAPVGSPIIPATQPKHKLRDDLPPPKDVRNFSDDIPLPHSPSQAQLPHSPLQLNPVDTLLPATPVTTDHSEPPSISTTPERTKPPRPDRPPRPKMETFEPVPRDRYGFKKESQWVSVSEYDEWNVQYTESLDRRRKKWIALMTQWGLAKENPIRFPPKSDKVKRYIRKGIPPDWRGAAWFWYAGGPSRIAQNPGQYRRLCDQAAIGFMSDTDREIIERDLNRTFPDHIKFKPDPVPEVPSDQNFPGRNVRPGGSRSTSSAGIETPIVKSLRRVLQAFSIHNPNIGYCQSLNFLAGMLLIFLDDEEKAFHLLNIITSVHLPGTHAKVLETNVDVGVLMSCIQDAMPAVWAKIDDIDEGRGQISTNRLPTVSLATTAWFMSCFIGNLPYESVLRVWDSFFYEGSKTLFRVALAIFKVGEWEIRNVNEHMEVFQVVQLIPRRLIDASVLMESCFKRRNGFGHLSQETIDDRRKERRAALQQDRDRKNGQLNPTLTDDLAVVNKSESRGTGLKRVASKARLRRTQSRKRYPPMQEAN